MSLSPNDDIPLRLCLTCRAVVLEAGECPHPEEVADLAELAEHKRAIEHMESIPLPKLPRIGKPDTGAYDMTSGLLAIGYAAVAVSTSYWVWIPLAAGHALIGLRGVWKWRRFGRNDQKLLTTGLSVAGTIVEAGVLTSPGTGTDCAAFHVELRIDGRPEDSLSASYARTARLMVNLDDGRRALIPAGAVRLHPTPPPQRLNTKTRSAIHDRFVERIDPHRKNGSDVISYDRLCERWLRIGDRVAIECELIPHQPSGQDNVGHAYRDSAPTVVAPRGIPVLRALRSPRKAIRATSRS